MRLPLTVPRTVGLLAVAAIAVALLLGSSVLAPAAPVPPLAGASPGAVSPWAHPSGEPPATATLAPASARPSPSRAPSVPSPTPLEFYPSIAPSSPLPTAPVAEPPTGRHGIPADGRPTRVVIPFLNIDLPIVRGDLGVRGNRGNYPLCDVAQYLVALSYPGEEGTAYIYAHAQRGMFLPMLRASWRNNGRAMLGQRVDVYTSDARLHRYEIVRVKRHSTDLNIAFNVAPGEHKLVLQTSEGPPGHRPVLQVAARAVGIVETTEAEAMPRPRPRVCLPP